MIPESREHPVPARRGLRARFTADTHSVDREDVIRLTNSRGDHHLAHVDVGDTVTLCGRVIAVTYPPSASALWNGYEGHRPKSEPPRSIVTLDDGTAHVEFEIDRATAREILGKTVEVSGTLRRDRNGYVNLDAVMLDQLNG